MNNSKLRILNLILAGAFAWSSSCFGADENPQTLDKTLKPAVSSDPTSEDVSSVFRDMGVVQRKAMNKSNKLLFSSFINMDFSDGPYSMYGLNVAVGYAISDFWELYINTAPYFLNNKRSMAQYVESLTLEGGQTASINKALAQRQYGVELLWAPLYGKDSLGSHSVVRSDTFLKFGAMMIQYDQGQGMKFHLGVGKTYFISRWAGFRITASGNYVQSIFEGVKSFSPVVMLETGLVAYLF